MNSRPQLLLDIFFSSIIAKNTVANSDYFYVLCSTHFDEILKSEVK
jgi:hypothetical protein